MNLAKVLAKNNWKREFRWMNTSEGFDFVKIGKNEAVVLIGDQCFEFENNFRYKIDLAGEWKDFSGLPFVFACWTANRLLPADFIEEFNDALATGVKNIDLVVERFGKTGSITGADLKTYLTENIDFDLNDEKRKAMKFFLELLKELR